MKEYRFEVEISRDGRVAADFEKVTADADRAVWKEAVAVLVERDYDDVRVRVDWSAAGDGPSIHLPLLVIDEREKLVPRDIPPYIELFFHDAFLLFNLAAPGSFGGVIAPAGGNLRVSELMFDAFMFEMAWITGRPAVGALPLGDVVRWYESLGLGTSQIATTGTAKALFHLLHLGREPLSILRLAQAAEALFEGQAVPRLPRLFELRDALVRGDAPVLHPMHDELLDPRLEDDSLDWTSTADEAAAAIVGELQARIRGT